MAISQYHAGLNMLIEHGMRQDPKTLRWANGRKTGQYWHLQMLEPGMPGLVVEGHKTMANVCFELKTICIANNLSDEEFEQTMLHEIMHIKCRKGGHGLAWMRKALKLGCKLEHIAPYLVAFDEGQRI
jgi:hypothetical protein